MILSIIIPAFNEEKTILKLLDKVLSVELKNIKKEIIIINDCSTDKTKEIVLDFIKNNKNQDIKIISNNTNKGKGYSLNKGIKNANGDIIIFQDADLEYDPQEYKILIKPIIDGFADVVYGSRFQGSKPHRILFFWHTIGNKFLTFISNVFTNLNLTDMETCYKVFKREIISQIEITENRFGIEPEITAKISKIKNLRLYEVGISYYGRTYEEGKKIGWKDGVRAIYAIIKFNLIK
jgi:glycosyltransferase involved in cell wall biosynthesis